MYWLDSYAGHNESAVQLMWHTNLCIPSRTEIRTKRTAIQTILIEKHTNRTSLAIQTIPSTHQELLVLQWLHAHTRPWWLGKLLWNIYRLCCGTPWIGAADALRTVSCCQEPQCSSQSETCRNGLFIVSCQLLYSGCESFQNLIKCVRVHSEVILEAGNIFFLQFV